MTITSSFFDHQKYPAQEFINRDKDFIGNGVLHPATDFALTYNNNMTVSVGAGTSWVNGMRIGYDANPALTLAFANADTTNPRVDLIEIGTTGTGTQGQGVIQIVKGVPASTPLQPQPDSGFVGLYAVLIPANSTQVSSLNITDLRTGINIVGATTMQLAQNTPGTQSFGTTGSIGTSPRAAREDHVHPMPTISMPSSLPANGGNSTTVNNYTASATPSTNNKTDLIGMTNEVLGDLTSHEADYTKHDGNLDDTGTANAYVITLNPAPTVYAEYQTFKFKAKNSNTGTSTLNVNSLGVKTIYKNVNVPLATGDILSGQIITVIFDGTNFQLIPMNNTAQTLITNPMYWLSL